MRQIREEFTDAPVEVGEDTAYDRGRSQRVLEAVAQKAAERERVEEEGMIRLRTTKEERKDMKRLRQQMKKGGKAQGAVSLQDLTDLAISDVAADMDDFDESSTGGPRGRKS